MIRTDDIMPMMTETTVRRWEKKMAIGMALAETPQRTATYRNHLHPLVAAGRPPLLGPCSMILSFIIFLQQLLTRLSFFLYLRASSRSPFPSRVSLFSLTSIFLIASPPLHFPTHSRSLPPNFAAPSPCNSRLRSLSFLDTSHISPIRSP